MQGFLEKIFAEVLRKMSLSEEMQLLNSGEHPTMYNGNGTLAPKCE